MRARVIILKPVKLIDDAVTHADMTCESPPLFSALGAVFLARIRISDSGRRQQMTARSARDSSPQSAVFAPFARIMFFQRLQKINFASVGTGSWLSHGPDVLIDPLQSGTACGALLGVMDGTAPDAAKLHLLPLALL